VHDKVSGPWEPGGDGRGERDWRKEWKDGERERKRGQPSGRTVLLGGLGFPEAGALLGDGELRLLLESLVAVLAHLGELGAQLGQHLVLTLAVDLDLTHLAKGGGREARRV